jgi:hypothetical protein
MQDSQITSLSSFSCNITYVNLGCLHPVACVRSDDGFFPRLRNVTIVGEFYYLILLILLHVSVVRPSSSRK